MIPETELPGPVHSDVAGLPAAFPEVTASPQHQDQLGIVDQNPGPPAGYAEAGRCQRKRKGGKLSAVHVPGGFDGPTASTNPSLTGVHHATVKWASPPLTSRSGPDQRK